MPTRHRSRTAAVAWCSPPIGQFGFKEAGDQPRTMDYPFTLIEIRFNK